MCFKTAVLEHGHVVPSFVFRWLKETAALPYLRTGEKPNVRTQDGWKRHWFCRACENQIGRDEKAFAEQLFPLIVTQQQEPYPYGPWLSRFVASVAWRTVLLYTEYDDSFDYFTPDQKALLPRALEHWRAFVSGEAETPMVHELHFIPMALWSAFQGPKTPPPNINRYAMRAVEIHVASTSSQAFAYVKMGPAVAVGFIQPPPPDNWVGTQVALGDGQVAQRMGVPASFIEYLMDRATKALVSERERSARQRQKINQALEANLERTAASETTRALEADVQMFGIEQVFSPEDNPEG